MNIRKSLVLSVVAVTLAGSGLSFAASRSGSVVNDSSGFLVTATPGTQTRAQVIGELEAARKNGTFLYSRSMERELSTPVKSTESKLTRAQVRQELFSQSPEEKKLLQHSYGHN